MKILTIIANPLGWLNPNNFGGGEINTVTSLTEWQNQGHEIISIEPDKCSISKKLNKTYETRLIKLPFKKNSTLTSIFRTFFWTFRVYSSVKKEEDYDFVYASTSNITDILPAYIIAKVHKKPLVSSVRVSVYDKNTKKIFEKLREEGSSLLSSFARAVGARIAIWMLQRCRIVLTPCKLIKETLICLGIKADRIKVLDHGIETGEIVKRKTVNKKYDLCYFSRVEKNKGIYDFLEICKRFAKENKNFSAVIIGNGSESKNVEKFIKKENLNNHIYCPGFVLGSEKFDYIKKSKMVLYPTYAREGWGIIVPETLCCGTPMISYDNEITKNVFGKLNTVFFVKTGNLDDLFEASTKVLNMDHEKYNNLSKQCVKDGLSYDIKKMAKKELEVLKTVK